MTNLQGQRVVIRATSNKFAQGDIGKAGTVNGEAPLGMVIVKLDDGRDFWANPSNLSLAA